MNQLTNNESESVVKAEENVRETQTKEASPKRAMSIWLILTLLVVFGAIGWFVYKGVTTRVSAEKALVVETHDAAVLSVSVTHPKMTNATQELVLPGNTQPLIDSPVYA